jgi:hypothetical protein
MTAAAEAFAASHATPPTVEEDGWRGYESAVSLVCTSSALDNEVNML